ncbi:guanine nucleotide-binding protein subunit alpha [Saitoella coloradoensis]
MNLESLKDRFAVASADERRQLSMLVDASRPSDLWHLQSALSRKKGAYFDIVSALPPELLTGVLDLLEINDFGRMQMVCKKWRELLTSPLHAQWALKRYYPHEYTADIARAASVNDGRYAQEFQRIAARGWAMQTGHAKQFGILYPEGVDPAKPEETSYPIFTIYKEGWLVMYSHYNSDPARLITIRNLQHGLEAANTERKTSFYAPNREQMALMCVGGGHMAGVSFRRTAYVWNLVDGTLVNTFKLASAAVHAMDCNEKYLAAAFEHEIIMWDLAENRIASCMPLESLEARVVKVIGMAIDGTDPRLIYTAVQEIHDDNSEHYRLDCFDGLTGTLAKRGYLPDMEITFAQLNRGRNKLFFTQFDQDNYWNVNLETMEFDMRPCEHVTEYADEEYGRLFFPDRRLLFRYVQPERETEAEGLYVESYDDETGQVRMYNRVAHDEGKDQGRHHDINTSHLLQGDEGWIAYCQLNRALVWGFEEPGNMYPSSDQAQPGPRISGTEAVPAD